MLWAARSAASVGLSAALRDLQAIWLTIDRGKNSMDIDSSARAILLELRAKVESGGEGGIYGDRTKALHDIDALLANPSANQVKLLLLPTANLQELSIDCGWGSQFNNLAAQLEAVLGID